MATPERGAVAGQQPHGEAAGERPKRPSGASRLFDAGPTLEDRVLALWDELTVSGRAECPVCGGTMRVAGGCDGCGAELS